MEAVGGAAAIAELSVLSLKAGKAAKSLVQSIRNAPAEIIELNFKIERLHALLQQIDLLCEDLPGTNPHMLVPPEHWVLLSFGLQKTLDSLTKMNVNCGAQAEGPLGLRDRLRWATLDKKKAQRFLEEVRQAELDLNTMLHILELRISSMSQTSLVTLSVGQASLHADLKQSLEEVKTLFHKEISKPKEHPSPTSATTTQTRRICMKGQETHLGNDLEPSHRLIEHNVRRTLNSYVASIGNGGSPTAVRNSMSSVGAGIAIGSKRKSIKVRLMFNLCWKLFARRILEFETQILLNCSSWTLTPRVASSLAIFNLRPSNSPIFLACRDHDFDEVRYLLENGQASIYDVDDNIGGLLEHVVSGKSIHNNRIYVEQDFLKKGQGLLEHLLDQGCDPNLHHTGNKNSQPAILAAFDDGYTAAITAMTYRRADLESCGTNLAGLFGNAHDMEAFLWKVRLLRSLGYSDWLTKDPCDNLLYGACWYHQIDLVLFALEVVKIDLNLLGSNDRAPIGNAARDGWLEGVAILLEAGACPNVSDGSWNGTPLIRSLRSYLLNDLSHYLLLSGADPRMCDSHGASAWSNITINSMHTKNRPIESDWYNGFNFVHFEGSISHLLHHGADPFEIFVTLHNDSYGPILRSRPQWFDRLGLVRASDIARFWSYGIQDQPFFMSDPVFETWRHELEEAECTGAFAWTFNWDHRGNIIPRRGNVVQDEAMVSNTSLSVYGDCQSEDTESSSAESICSYEGPEFYQNATRFYHHISNEQGRRQLSRFPMVRALCDALNHAGYRAEMDEDGDIWYDCDDGDRYFDALEGHVDESYETWFPRTCPICQDFEGYGLGHVLESAERAKEQYYEYKEKVQQGKRSF